MKTSSGEVVSCPYCGERGYYDGEGSMCWKCGTLLTAPPTSKRGTKGAY